ncbi:MAG: ABC transporter substrate-binding protein, partial [Candidatus Methanomethyliaceae archaeon]
APEKTSIRIGFTLSKSGFAATSSETLHWKPYNLWKEQVNAAGGIYVKELGKKLPVEFIWYDDKSDIESVIRLYEKLITEDQVDFVLTPWGTGFNLPLVPLITKYGHPFIMSTCVSLSLLSMFSPYVYHTGSGDGLHVKTYGEFFESIKDDVQNVAVVYPDVDFGIENGVNIKKFLEERGFNIVLFEMYPVTATDLSSLILKAKERNVDTFIAWSYPSDSALLLTQSMGLGFSPKYMYLAISLAIPGLLQAFGEAAEGILTL